MKAQNHHTMNHQDRTQIINALSALSICCEELMGVCQIMLDPQDGRLTAAASAISAADNAIDALRGMEAKVGDTVAT